MFIGRIKMSAAVGVAILVFAGVDTALTVKLINRVSEPGYGIEKMGPRLTPNDIEIGKVRAATFNDKESLETAGDYFRLGS